MVEKFDRKESCMQEHLYKYFQTEGHKGFLNEESVTFIDKNRCQRSEKKRKILDANIENNGSLWGLILQIVCSRLILYFACLLIIIFGPLLFFIVFYFYGFL